MQKNDERIPVITIDGPSGTGKGTVSAMLAQHLHWHFLDSGAIYRVLAFAMQEEGVGIDDIAGLSALANHLDFYFAYDDGHPCVYYRHRNISSAIRQEWCAQNASKVAAIPVIRALLLSRQRAFAKLPGLVTDGRDMGTTVFPTAMLKIYLDARQDVRAERRWLQLKKNGIYVSLADVSEDMIARDCRDAERSTAPLRPAEDAFIIDTSTLDVAGVFDRILSLVNMRLAEY